MYAPYYIVSVAGPAVPHFPTLSHKRHDFQNKKLFYLKYVFLFSLQILPEIFFIVRGIQYVIIIKVQRSSCKVPAILVRF